MGAGGAGITLTSCGRSVTAHLCLRVTNHRSFPWRTAVEGAPSGQDIYLGAPEADSDPPPSPALCSGHLGPGVQAQGYVGRREQAPFILESKWKLGLTSPRGSSQLTYVPTVEYTVLDICPELKHLQITVTDSDLLATRVSLPLSYISIKPGSEVK